MLIIRIYLYLSIYHIACQFKQADPDKQTLHTDWDSYHIIAYHYLSLQILPVIGRIFVQCYDLFRKRLKSHFVRFHLSTSHSKLYIYAFTTPVVCPPVAAKR